MNMFYCKYIDCWGDNVWSILDIFTKHPQVPTSHPPPSANVSSSRFLCLYLKLIKFQWPSTHRLRTILHLRHPTASYYIFDPWQLWHRHSYLGPHYRSSKIVINARFWGICCILSGEIAVRLVEIKHFYPLVINLEGVISTSYTRKTKWRLDFSNSSAFPICFHQSLKPWTSESTPYMFPMFLVNIGSAVT